MAADNKTMSLLDKLADGMGKLIFSIRNRGRRGLDDPIEFILRVSYADLDEYHRTAGRWRRGEPMR